MKNKAKKSILIILCLIFASSLLVSCKDEVEVLSDGYFKYIVVTRYDGNPTHEPVVAIVGFTASGLKQEVLEIPRELGGKPVRFIGYTDNRWGNIKSFSVYSEKLRKIYVHDNIEIMVNFDGALVDMMICSYRFNTVFDFFVLFKNKFIYKSLIDDVNYLTSNFTPANIVFMNNYSNEVNGGYYRLDNIQVEEKIPVPPNPTRSGYEFMGWYTEPDCINAWDFDKSPTIKRTLNSDFLHTGR